VTGERPPYLPGDRAARDDTARMIRVDQAGEYGATRIYQGQLAVIRRGRAAGAIREMAPIRSKPRAPTSSPIATRRSPTTLSRRPATS
jgi:ubiquinone biosynthesis monooxygenase Coq7